MSLQILPHVIVGGGHFINQGGQLVQQCMQHLPQIQSAFERGIELVKHHSDKAEKAERMRQHAQEQLERCKDGVIDLGLAFGNGAAGNYDDALQNALDAAAKAAEIFAEQCKAAWTF